jgi:hypothetical protein
LVKKLDLAAASGRSDINSRTAIVPCVVTEERRGKAIAGCEERAFVRPIFRHVQARRALSYVDRLVAYVAPSWALRRARARQAFYLETQRDLSQVRWVDGSPYARTGRRMGARADDRPAAWWGCVAHVAPVERLGPSEGVVAGRLPLDARRPAAADAAVAARVRRAGGAGGKGAHAHLFARTAFRAIAMNRGAAVAARVSGRLASAATHDSRPALRHRDTVPFDVDQMLPTQLARRSAHGGACRPCSPRSSLALSRTPASAPGA